MQDTNCIIQNLTSGPHSNGNVLEVSGATRIFITKCTFHDSTDELCSIVRQADNVTVSWCRFYFNTPDDHSYGNLIGNGDDVTADRGKLHVTMHHNWYDNGVKGRMPRVRFAIYIFTTITAVTTQTIVSEPVMNAISGLKTPISAMSKTRGPITVHPAAAAIGWSGLLLDGTSQPAFTSNSFPVFTPPYSFTMDPVNNVESIVRAGAGNVFQLM